MCPPGYGLILYAPAEMECLGIRRASQRGRAERVPPRKSKIFPRKAILPWLAHPSEGRAPHARYPRFSPQGHLTLGQPPSEGRAPHARKEGITQTTTLPRFGHGPFADPGVAMTCPGLGSARICGRAERVPPRKSPFALSPGFPARRPTLRLAPLGGAGSARPQ
jgi:hypothetical protein